MPTVPDINDSYKLVELEYKSPLSVSWEVTGRCNLHCIHCHRYFSGYRELNTKSMLHILRELFKAEVLSLTITGGEPLLRRDIKEILDAAFNYGFEIHLVSNGVLINERIANMLSEYEVEAAISVDGSIEEIHDSIRGVGAFKETMDGCKHLREASVKFGIILTLFRTNVSDLRNVLKLAQENGAHLVIVNRPITKDPSIADLLLSPEEYLEVLKEVAVIRKTSFSINADESLRSFLALIMESSALPCLAAKTVCTVSPDGTLRPCPAFSHEFSSKKSLLEESLENIWRTSKALKKVRNFDVERISSCRDCRFSNDCTKGCRAAAFVRHGTLAGRDPDCPFQSLGRI